MQISVIREVALPAANLWAVIEDFDNISWMPGVDKIDVIGSGIGMTRCIHMTGLPAPIEEQLTAIDADSMTLDYTIPRGLPMPLDDYRGRVRLEAISPASTRIIWSCMCTPRGISDADAKAIMEGTFNQLIDWISERVRSLQT